MKNIFKGKVSAKKLLEALESAKKGKNYKTADEAMNSILGKRKFDTGAIRDDDTLKEDYIETISWTAFKRYAEYMTSKKARYGSGNF